MATNKFQPLDGKTWRKSFKLKGEKFDIELSYSFWEMALHLS